MALPTKEKTWIIDPLNLISYVSTAQLMGDSLLAIKNSLLTMAGVTVKGSGGSSAAAMDAVDRWTTSAQAQTHGASISTVQSWIVLDLANMGGAELLLANWGANDNRISVYLSPGGNYVINGTNARYKPTATDELNIYTSTVFVLGGVYPHYWTTWLASDGTALMFGVAGNGSWPSVFGAQMVTSLASVGTFDPPVVLFYFADNTYDIGNWPNVSLVACRLDPGNGIPVNIPGWLGSLGLKTGNAAYTYTGISDLQGGENLLYPIYVWSETETARGLVCKLVDIWVGNTSNNDSNAGDTYGNHDYVQIDDMIFPWDGSVINLGDSA